VDPLAESSLPEKEQADEGALQEERECALHSQGLGDDVTGKGGEGGPVGAELELHRDAGHDAEDEGDGEDLAPEPRGLVVEVVAGPHVDALEHEYEQRQTHGEHGKQVMVGYGEGELQPRCQ
jgi:hypothetical protein